MRIRHIGLTFIASIGLLISQNSIASDSDEWNFEVTPYLFASGLKGEVGIRGVTADIDMSFDDIVDHLDAGFMGLATAKKDRWLFAVEGVYSKLSGAGTKSVTGPGGRVNVKNALDLTNEMSIYSGTVGYRLLDEKTRLYVLGGIRYTDLEVDVDVANTGAFTGPIATRPFSGALSADGSESWTDAFVGVHAIHPVSENVDLVGYVDVGGGDSDSTYMAQGGVNWEFKEDYIAKFGYRILDQDYEDNNGFEWDMQLSGIYMGLGIRF